MTTSDTATEQRSYFRIFSFVVLLVLLVLSFLLVGGLLLGFAPDHAKQQAYLYGYKRNELPLSEEQKNSAAERFLPYVLMSAHAYCTQDHDTEEIQDLGWELYEGVSASGGACPPGFYSEVWKTTNQEGPIKLVVAFRGTTGLCDWKTNLVQPISSNLQWIGRPWIWLYERVHKYYRKVKSNGLPAEEERVNEAEGGSDSCSDHYEKAAKKIALLYNGFPKKDRKIELYTTGHSLGGGLAEHALYKNPNIVRQAIGFNPSPVTDFSKVCTAKQRAACRCSFEPDAASVPNEPRVYRIFESGELLQWLRGL